MSIFVLNIPSSDEIKKCCFLVTRNTKLEFRDLRIRLDFASSGNSNDFETWESSFEVERVNTVNLLLGVAVFLNQLLDLLCVDVLKHTNGNPVWVSKCTSCISLTFVQSGRQYNALFRALKAKYAVTGFFSGHERGRTTLVGSATWLVC